MSEEWDWPHVELTSDDWDAIYSDPDDVPMCTICGDSIEDRQYCCALFVFRAWSPMSVEYRFAHVQCLRRQMHHTSPLR